MPGLMFPTYHISCATLNASLALVVEPLSDSGEPDQSAAPLVERTPQVLLDEQLCHPNPSPVIWLRSTAPAASLNYDLATGMSLQGLEHIFTGSISGRSRLSESEGRLTATLPPDIERKVNDRIGRIVVGDLVQVTGSFRICNLP